MNKRGAVGAGKKVLDIPNWPVPSSKEGILGKVKSLHFLMRMARHVRRGSDFFKKIIPATSLI